MSNDKNPREELYQRFRKALSMPVADRYFDEDELVEIYDYAGDLSDDYVQMEVLFCGARLYPESTALSERRALLYLDTSIDDSDKPSPAAGEYLDDNADTVSPIFDIARLEIHRPDDPEAALEFLLNQYESFGDEEIIRFLDLAFDLDCYKWVVANLDRLRSKVRYQPVLVYELMQEADEMLDNELMAQLAEELIESEPFAVNYWVTLFRAQARGEREEEAKSTFDYARALGADDTDALLVLVEAVCNFAPYLYNEAYEILEGLKEEKPDEFLYVDWQCVLLVRAGSTDRAVKLLKAYLAAHPENQQAMRQLLVCNIPEALEYVKRFYEATGGKGFDSEVLAELLNTLSMNAMAYSIIALMQYVSAKDEEIDPRDLCAWVESLFELEKYTEVVALVEAYRSREGGEQLFHMLLHIPLKGEALSFAYMVSLIKVGRFADAEMHFSMIRPYLEELIAESLMPVRMAVRTLFTLADKMRQHPASDTLYWDYFDMLNYGKQDK
ncbi:MAG: hypothetical protein NC418_08780 [Muribaculaceae bacterium]|nr:hypothetical protein [Muribaculaceae bacterium]